MSFLPVSDSASRDLESVGNSPLQLGLDPILYTKTNWSILKTRM